MTPNWYVDGREIETLLGGASIVALQIYNSWRSIRNEHRIDSVRSLVASNDEQILADLSSAQTKLDSIRSQLTGTDRRKPGSPIFLGGRRSTDPPPPVKGEQNGPN